MLQDWNRSEAYDLSLYAEETEAPEKRPPMRLALTPEKRARVRYRMLQKALSRRLAAVAVMIVLFLVTVVTYNISALELGDRLRSKQEELLSLREEYGALSAGVAGIGEEELSEYAAEKGFCRVRPGQVTYVRLSDGDAAVRTAHAPTGSVLETVMDSMDAALETLRIK